MKKFILSTLLLAAAAAATVGCSKGENTGTEPKTPEGEITLRGRSLGVESRAPFDGAISTTNKLTAYVVGSLTSTNYQTPYVGGSVTFADQSALARFADGFTGSNSYPASGDVFLCGLYPDANWTINAADGLTADYTFVGHQDLMAAGEVSTSKDDAKQSVYPALEFKHLLTRVELQVVAESAESAAAWGTLSDISLVGSFHSVATVTLFGGTAAQASAFSTPVTGWAVYEPASDTKFATPVAIAAAVDNSTNDKIIESAKAVGYTMLAPSVATGTGDFTISVTTKFDDQAAPITISDIKVGLKDKQNNAFTGDTQGKKFTITLIFRASDIKATAKVTDWVDGGSGNGEIS